MDRIDNIVIRGYNHPVSYYEKLTKGDLTDYRYDDGESESDQINGACNSNTLDIRIATHMSPDIQLITLWHEIVHMLLVHGSIPIGEHDERHIDVLAYAMIELIRENPGLIKITQEQKTP